MAERAGYDAACEVKYNMINAKSRNTYNEAAALCRTLRPYVVPRECSPAHIVRRNAEQRTTALSDEQMSNAGAPDACGRHTRA